MSTSRNFRADFQYDMLIKRGSLVQEYGVLELALELVYQSIAAGGSYISRRARIIPLFSTPPSFNPVNNCIYQSRYNAEDFKRGSS